MRHVAPIIACLSCSLILCSGITTRTNSEIEAGLQNEDWDHPHDGATNEGPQKARTRTVPKVHLLSFRSCFQNMNAECSKIFYNELLNLGKIASKLPHIDNVHLYHGLPSSIANNPKWSKHLARTQKLKCTDCADSNSTLDHAGFWFWKAALIEYLMKLREFQDGDVVIWADGDSNLQITKQCPSCHAEDAFSGLLDPNVTWDFFITPASQCEYAYTKGDIFHRFGVAWNDNQYGMTQQVHANFFLLRVNSKTRKLIKALVELNSNLGLINNEDSKFVHESSFLRHNRNDQSLLSMLLKASVPTMVEDDKCWKEAGRKFPEKGTFSRWKRHEVYGIEGLDVRIGGFSGLTDGSIQSIQRLRTGSAKHTTLTSKRRQVSVMCEGDPSECKNLNFD